MSGSTSGLPERLHGALLGPHQNGWVAHRVIKNRVFDPEPLTSKDGSSL